MGMSTKCAHSGIIRKAFSFLEIMVVCVVIGILAAIVVPQFGGVTDDAKSSATIAAVGGVRASIAGYRAKNILQGGTTFPTRVQLIAAGTVLQGEMPVNPYSNLNTVQTVTKTQADSRSVLNATQYGWNYFMDNSLTPPVAVFYANSSNATTVSNGNGGTKTANQL